MQWEYKNKENSPCQEAHCPGGKGRQWANDYNHGQYPKCFTNHGTQAPTNQNRLRARGGTCSNRNYPFRYWITGPSRGPRERPRAGMGLQGRVGSSVFEHLVHVTWYSVVWEAYARRWAREGVYQLHRWLGHSATALLATSDFNHGHRGQFHKLTVSYVKGSCLSIFCPRAVSTLQLSQK